MLKDNQFIEQVYVDELKIKKPGEYVWTIAHQEKQKR